MIHNQVGTVEIEEDQKSRRTNVKGWRRNLAGWGRAVWEEDDIRHGLLDRRAGRG